MRIAPFRRATLATRFLTLAAAAALVPALVPARPAPPAEALLSYDELVRLYDADTPADPLKEKLATLLATPFVDNTAWDRGARPLRPESPKIGRTLRVAMWNIERGLEFDAVVAAFRGRQQFERYLNLKDYPKGSHERAEVLREVEYLKGADVVVINEADWGLERTKYRNVTAELAAALRMNYAYGVEFVEVDPLTLGTEKFEEETEESKARFRQNLTIDTKRTKGLHGTAILSRYRLDNVRLIRFQNQGHDWYTDEKKEISEVEEGKRKAAEVAFLEKIFREVRRGGRMMMLADIEDEAIPGGKATIVATHLEAKTKPENRLKQLEEVLAAIKDIPYPVILAGDMNTTGSDSTPTSLNREIKKRLGSKEFWATQGLKYGAGIGLPFTLPITALNYARTYRDPTARNIPLFAPNKEAKFFDTLEKFRFADGNAFDFRGDKTRSANGQSGQLANSNERAAKGFATTFRVERALGPSGKMKLDWIFVKPASLTDSGDAKQSYRFAPHYGRTLKEMNYGASPRISDHNPVVVDLPFADPAAIKPKAPVRKRPQRT